VNYRYSLLLPAMLVVLLFVGSVSAGVWPDIPSPPYNPRDPAENIVTVEAYLNPVTDASAAATSAGVVVTEYGLQLFVYMERGTPAGHTLYILVTQLKGDPGTETQIMSYDFPGPTGTDALVLGGQVFAVGTPDIAVYAWLDTPGTDRAPNDGFYSITSLSARAPDVFRDPEGSPVGGVVMPTNKTEILAPLLAIAGIIAAVSTVELVVRRRKD